MFSDVPFGGEVKGKYQGKISNGKMGGPWVSYWSNGLLDYKGDYKNGKRQGSWVSYWSDGQLYSKGDYKNGKKEGRWVEYGSNGDLWKAYSGVYKNGVKISD